MGKLVVMIVLGGLLSACSSGPVRVHGADVSARRGAADRWVPKDRQQKAAPLK